MRSEDLTPLFAGTSTVIPAPPVAGSKVRQGTVLAFDPDTGANTIDIGGVVMSDLPVDMVGAVPLAAGFVVQIDTTTPSWFVKGVVTEPGTAGTVPAWPTDIAAAQATADLALATAGSDGIPPATSPAPVMLAGIESMIARWTPITNSDSVTYQVHISDTLGFTATWDNPATLAGSTTGSQFTIRALPGAEPAPGDPDPRTLSYDVPYYVRVIAGDADGHAAQSLQGVGFVFQVTGANIAVDTVTAANIVTGSLTGELFSATVIYAGTFKTSETGQRVWTGVAGIQGYRANGSLMISIPTEDGQEILLDGEIIARGLTVIGGASFQSTQNEITKDASITLQRGTVSPSASPVFSTVYDTVQPSTTTLTAAQKTNNDPTWGLGGPFDLGAAAVSCIQYLPAETMFVIHHTRTNGTRAWFFNPDGTPKDRYGTGVYFADLKDWEVWSVVEMTTSSTPAKNGTYTMFRFIPGAAADWYVSSPAGIARYNRPAGAVGVPTLTTNGQDVAIVEVIGSALNIGYRTYPGTGNVPAATTTYTSPTGSYATSLAACIFDSHGASPGGFDITTGVGHRYATAERGVAYSTRLIYQQGAEPSSLFPGGSGGWSSTSRDAESFESPTSNRRGMAWDGTQFWTYGGDGFLYKHTGEHWDSGVPVNGQGTWWGRQTFYDSDATGGTHETMPGVWKSFTMPRRAKVLFSPPDLSIIDAGGIDDPDKVRLYMGRGATQPTNANMHLQLTVSVPTQFTTMATATAIPPTSNTFPGATPAKIRNDNDTLVLSGDGSFKALTAQLGATGTVVTGLRFATFSGTVSGSGGIAVVTHSLGAAPTAVLVTGTSYWCRVAAISSTTFSVEFRSPVNNALIANGVAVSCYWIAAV